MTECTHPDDQREEAISHVGDPDWAYCYGCGAVVRKIVGEGRWRAEGGDSRDD